MFVTMDQKKLSHTVSQTERVKCVSGKGVLMFVRRKGPNTCQEKMVQYMSD